MKTTLQFDFIADKEKNTITVNKEFAAGRQLVWDCHTKQEFLDQWFAPAPLTTKTKSMDFREGGHWVYAMIDPAGVEYCGRWDYEKINPIKSYSLFDGFCDDKGVLNPDLPRATWDVKFTDRGESTLVETLVTYNSLTALEQVLAMGMKDGLIATLEKLDVLINKLTA
jgi:uncharacterized protein YndB with AHSA1/START domain